ncbi:MAG: CHAT domain-containing protein [Deltaproteobacteria bacterium]|nr:CHAT domain-containing protein [Deltaproteobacteria bacterium]
MSPGPRMLRSTSFVVLNLADSVAAAVRKLRRDLSARFVVLRRAEGDTVYWYVFLRDWLVGERLGEAGPGAPPPGPELRREPLRERLEGWIRETRAVETVPDDPAAVVWKVEYENAPWPAGALPIALAGGKPAAVFEPDHLAGGGPPPHKTHAKPPEARDVGIPARGFAYIGMPPLPRDLDLTIGGPPGTLVRAEPRVVFPSIDPAREHVVQATTLDVAVRLVHEKPKETVGGVALPESPPDEEHTLAVHLLFGPESQWGELTYSAARQTIRPAAFRITVPRLAAGPDGGAPERRIEALRANFYLKNRWCGEAVRHVEVLARESVAPCDEIPIPAEPEWRRWLCVDASAEPPDLLVRIQSQGTEQFLWSFLSPHATLGPYSAEACTIRLAGGPEGFVKNRFEPLVGADLTAAKEDLVEGICELIYRSAPTAFKDAYWTLYRLARSEPGVALDTIQFVTDEPHVPWELMQVADAERAPEVDAGILSVRHRVGRWVASRSCQLRQTIPVHELAVFATDYEHTDVEPKLPWANEERRHLVEAFGARPYGVTSDAVRAFLLEGKAEAVHFVCHGKMNAQTPDLSALILEDDVDTFQPPVVARQKVQRGLGAVHPLVFLNACQVGSQGAELSLMSGWPAAFLEMGASAFVAPLWTVNDERASEAAREFYDLVFGPDAATLGEALQAIRSHWAQKRNLTFLAYVLYGDPTARVVRA